MNTDRVSDPPGQIRDAVSSVAREHPGLVPGAAGTLVAGIAVAAELDSSSGRLVVMASGMTLVAGAVAPALGGFIAGSGNNWSQLGVVYGFLVLAGLPLLLGPVRVAKTKATLAAARTRPDRENTPSVRTSAVAKEKGPTE